jgi:hypothetical protein
MRLPLMPALTRALRLDGEHQITHIHTGNHGRPYVCDDPRCTSPSLEPADAARS